MVCVHEENADGLKVEHAKKVSVPYPPFGIVLNVAKEQHYITKNTANM